MGQHCDSCTCGRRAPVQREHAPSRHGEKAAGTIDWAEHLKAYEGYAAQYGSSQSAERLAERGGFGYGELVEFLGRDPETWVAR